MDLLYFLKTRLRFIEQLYDGAAVPFVETKRQIEAGERSNQTLTLVPANNEVRDTSS